MVEHLPTSKNDDTLTNGEDTQTPKTLEFVDDAVTRAASNLAALFVLEAFNEGKTIQFMGTGIVLKKKDE
jgi:hypothetical protein